MRVPTFPGVDFLEAVTAVSDLVIRAQQAAGDGPGERNIAAAAAQVAARHLAQHVLEDVVQVGARRKRIQILLVLLLRIRGIHAVQIRIVEVAALDAPHLVVHLFPLADGIHVDFDIGQLQGALAGFHGSGRRHDDVGWNRLDRAGSAAPRACGATHAQ